MASYAVKLKARKNGGAVDAGGNDRRRGYCGFND